MMKGWQRDLVGVGAPLTLSAATMAFAPEHDAPEWMILVASLGTVIAVAYGWWRLYVWMDRRQNYYLISGTMLLVALTGPAVGLMFDLIWLRLLAFLGPVAMGIFVSGFARHLSRRLASAQSTKSDSGS
jgi:hypothetical protein